MVILDKKNCSNTGSNCSLLPRIWNTTLLNYLKDLCVSSNKQKYFVNHKHLKLVHRMFKKKTVFLHLQYIMY